MDKGLPRLFQGLPTDDQVGDQIQQKILPGSPGGMLFDEDGGDEKNGGRRYFHQGFTEGLFLLVMVVMFVFVCHSQSV